MKAYDVIVVGAGVAGIACASELSKNGYHVLLLEARNRLGGRVYTFQSHNIQFPIELGAEFIHGKNQTIFKYIDQNRIPFINVKDHHVIGKKGKIELLENFWKRIEGISKHMNSHREVDQSVEDTLKGLLKTNKTKSLFKAFVEGFHAADIRKISEKEIAKTENEKEEGQSSLFRLFNGYSDFLNNSFDLGDVEIKINSVVRKIEWKLQNVTLHCKTSNGIKLYHAPKVVITVPIGVLKANSIKFSPPISFLENTLSGIEMGHVQRLILLFRSRFWEEFANEISFLHSENNSPFPIWWTQMPIRTPFLIAWQGGPKAEEMSNWTEKERVETALQTLRQLTSHPVSFLKKELLKSYSHNWSTDPFSKGAYSYVSVGGMESVERLKRPIDQTIFFAGEALANTSDRGTVHGALDTGLKTAYYILNLEDYKSHGRPLSSISL